MEKSSLLLPSFHDFRENVRNDSLWEESPEVGLAKLRAGVDARNEPVLQLLAAVLGIE